LVWSDALQQYGSTAARQEFLSGAVRKTVSLWLAPCVAFFLLGFEGRPSVPWSTSPVSSLEEPSGLRIQAVLGIGRVFGVVLILQLLHFSALL
jgi:hypothetical protein